MEVGGWRRFTLRKTAHAVDRAIRNVVASAYRAVSLFRSRLDAEGISPAQIDSREALAFLPPVSRDGRAAIPLDRLLREGTQAARCHVGPTSGTTGTPLMVYMSRAEALFRRIVLFLAMRRCARLAIPFSIAEVGTGRAGVGRERPFTHRLGLSRTERILRDLSPEAQAERLWETRAQVITGHPSCLEIVAEAIDDLGLSGSLDTRLVACRGRFSLRGRVHCSNGPLAARSPTSTTAKRSETWHGNARSVQVSCTSRPTDAWSRSWMTTVGRFRTARKGTWS